MLMATLVDVGTALSRPCSHCKELLCNCLDNAVNSHSASQHLHEDPGELSKLIYQIPAFTAGLPLALAGCRRLLHLTKLLQKKLQCTGRTAIACHYTSDSRMLLMPWERCVSP